ncbi:hypothetical protein P8452_76218 [Trifolium repens]|nr:hypothetical protein P8452_76218 [Trifolium repens]
MPNAETQKCSSFRSLISKISASLILTPVMSRCLSLRFYSFGIVVVVLKGFDLATNAILDEFHERDEFFLPRTNYKLKLQRLI